MLLFCVCVFRNRIRSSDWAGNKPIFLSHSRFIHYPLQSKYPNDLVQWQQHCCRCHRTNACTKVIISERLAISGWSISSSQQLISPRAEASLDRGMWSWSSTSSSSASASAGKQPNKPTHFFSPLFPSTRYSIVSSLIPLFIHFLHTLSTVNNIELEQLKQLNCCLDCPNAFHFILSLSLHVAALKKYCFVSKSALM